MARNNNKEPYRNMIAAQARKKKQRQKIQQLFGPKRKVFTVRNLFAEGHFVLHINTDAPNDTKDVNYRQIPRS